MMTRPVWVPDAVAKECMVCRTKFSTFVRKHHCRRCGRVVCSSCSPHHVSLLAVETSALGHAHPPGDHGKLERVCKECFKEMTAQHNRCKEEHCVFFFFTDTEFHSLFPHFMLANSQSRGNRDSKVPPSPSQGAVALSTVLQTLPLNSPHSEDHDSTDTEDSDDSSDEKVG